MFLRRWASLPPIGLCLLLFPRLTNLILFGCVASPFHGTVLAYPPIGLSTHDSRRSRSADPRPSESDATAPCFATPQQALPFPLLCFVHVSGARSNKTPSLFPPMLRRHWHPALLQDPFFHQTAYPQDDLRAATDVSARFLGLFGAICVNPPLRQHCPGGN